MPNKVIVAGVVIVVLMAIAVSTIEYFIPLSMKFELNAECRKTLLSMENEGGLSSANKSLLQAALAAKSFKNVVITAPQNIKQGQYLNLRVDVDYEYNSIAGLFKREVKTQHMVYNKSSMARKVVN